MIYPHHYYDTEIWKSLQFCSFEIDRPRRGGSRTALHVNKYVHRRYPGSSRTAPTKPALLIQIFLTPNHLSSLSILSDFIWYFFNRKSVIEPTPNTFCDYIVYNQSVHKVSGGCQWVSVVLLPTPINIHINSSCLPTYKLSQNIQ